MNYSSAYWSNTDSLSAQAALGAQNQELFPVRAEGVFGDKTFFKQPNEWHKARHAMKSHLKLDLYRTMTHCLRVSR